MSARIIILLSLSLCWLAGCAISPAGAEANRSGHPTLITGDFPVLANGMSAEEIRLKLGDPAEIRPMNRTEGNAEIWVYYFEKYLGRTEILTYVNRPALAGSSYANDPAGMVSEPVSTMVDQKVLVTVNLLMFNGRLVSQAAKSEQKLGF